MNKFVAFILISLFILACAGKDNTSSNNASAADGLAVYKKNCVLCHGMDGKLGVSGSKDITASVLSQAEREILIKNGKGMMTPFEGILSEDEIKAVAEYTMKIK